MVLQACDFCHLCHHDGPGCLGCILPGYQFIHLLTGEDVFGIAVPLITSVTGGKMGKFRWQGSVSKPREDIASRIVSSRQMSGDSLEGVKRPEKRRPRRRLAAEVTKLIHGQGLVSAKSLAPPTMALVPYLLAALLHHHHSHTLMALTPLESADSADRLGPVQST
ncbi:hypothetical protein QTO34_002146, partial [Cnephaeus nilssonii]